jgi:hypothetical protein
MLLRASGEITTREVDPGAVTDAGAAAASGVAHAEALVALADAMVGGDDAALRAARDAVLDALGPAGLVDAAGVASNFERMVRIADSTGIPLDPGLQMLSEDLRQELDLGAFGSSANTPEPGAGRRALGRALRPAFHAGLRLVGRIRTRGRPGAG